MLPLYNHLKPVDVNYYICLIKTFAQVFFSDCGCRVWWASDITRWIGILLDLSYLQRWHLLITDQVVKSYSLYKIDIKVSSVVTTNTGKRIVLPSALYACDLWTSLSKEDMRKLFQSSAIHVTNLLKTIICILAVLSPRK